MVNLKYVEKRKRNKIVTIASAIGSFIVATFVIVSFLGQRTGSYTVNLKNSKVSLALSTSSDFENPTTFLRVDELAGLDLNCYSLLKENFDEIDNEVNPYTIGGRYNKNNDLVALKYFKYTFFIKNNGENTASYDMSINIVSDSSDSDTSLKLSEILRCALFIDGECTVYAKRSNEVDHYSDNEHDTSTLEYLDSDHESGNYYGLAEAFIDSKTICKHTMDDFVPDEMIRYTMLFWLEGDDHECHGKAPEDAKLRLGVEIQAYEN